MNLKKFCNNASLKWKKVSDGSDKKYRMTVTAINGKGGLYDSKCNNVSNPVFLRDAAVYHPC